VFATVDSARSGDAAESWKMLPPVFRGAGKPARRRSPNNNNNNNNSHCWHGEQVGGAFDR